MAYQAEVYNVMLASPSDVDEEKQIAREIILDWNNINSHSRKIVLLPISWEHNSVPEMGSRPQEIINKQILRNADILVGIFWTRIGTPTGKAISGSVEEIQEHIASGKPAMLYFSNKPVIPDSIDHEQYDAVRKLKSELQSTGLTNDFDSVLDFRNKFQRHLSLKLNTEEYQTLSEEINDDFVVDASTMRKSLSDAAITLLREASKDAAGQIMKVGYIGGFAIQTNRTKLNEDDSARTKAKWEAAVEELLRYDLIVPVGYKGEIFEVTDLGFKVADELN